MSKKLLEEQAVRKFMKIAGLQPLTNSFLKESEEQKDLEEGYGSKKKKMEESETSEGENLEEATPINKGTAGTRRRPGLTTVAKGDREVDRKTGEDKGHVLAHDMERDAYADRGREHDLSTKRAGRGKDRHSGYKAADTKSGLAKLGEVEDLEENKEELEEGGGQMPFDAADRRADERAPDGVNEAKSLVAKALKMKGDSHKMKPAKKAGGLVKEEEMPEDDMGDVEAPEGDMGAGGLDVEGLVKELIRVITDKVPGAADVVSVEEEGGETEVEMGGEEGEMEGGEEELDEAALENVVAETVKRVKARLMESQKPKTLTKEALAKKVAAKVAERLKKG
jgi:hypothetical protein